MAEHFSLGTWNLELQSIYNSLKYTDSHSKSLLYHKPKGPIASAYRVGLSISLAKCYVKMKRITEDARCTVTM